jgi:hypothetical protein
MTMIDIQVTEQELNTILHGLYILEDQTWFIGKDVTEKLINQLNGLDRENTLRKEAICDI